MQNTYCEHNPDRSSNGRPKSPEVKLYNRDDFLWQGRTWRSCSKHRQLLFVHWLRLPTWTKRTDRWWCCKRWSPSSPGWQSFDVLIIIQIKEHWSLLTCQIPHCPMTQVKRRNNIVPQMFRRHLVTKPPSQSRARSSCTQKRMFWLTSWERPQSNQTWSLSPS